MTCGMVLVVLAVLTMAATHMGEPAWAAETDPLARGRYVFALAGGCGCHTPKGGPVNAGGRPLKTPFGTFYGTNITPDPTYGIGQWTDRQVIDSIRPGVRPDGSVLSPVMPYPAFSGMSDEDVAALVTYLRSLPPVARENQPHQLSLPFASLGMRMWRWLFFAPGVAPARTPVEGVERGRYISEHVAHCQECHTPRTRTGTLDRSLYLAGNQEGIDGEVTPNITPDPKTGIGDWSEEEIVSLLQTGFRPNFDNVQGLMALVIEGVREGGYKDMTQEDALAVARYLKSVPPIVHRVEREKEKK
ncbi:MAG: c-type cytochrome [Deltaproteobacteria bacterium]|nr:c-type cytochrome [Deltaproteobacteria bacterium]